MGTDKYGEDEEFYFYIEETEEEYRAKLRKHASSYAGFIEVTPDGVEYKPL